MISIAMMVIPLIFGIFLGRHSAFGGEALKIVNSFIVHIALPAVTLLHVHGVDLDHSLLSPLAMAWILFAVGTFFFEFVGRSAGWSRGTIGALILTGALASTSFLGLPMIDALAGEAEASTAGSGLVGQAGGYMILATLGTYLVLWTLGALTAAACADGKPSYGRAMSKIAGFTPLYALALAILLQPVAFPPAAETLLEILGASLVPLAMISLGSQLHFRMLAGRMHALAIGLTFKLLIGPALIMLLLVDLMGVGGRVAQVTVFEAAMGPQLGASALALQHNLDRSLIALMVSVGVPLSLATAPFWWWLMTGV